MALKHTPPRDAKQRYLKDKRPEISKKSHYNYETDLRLFCDWLEELGIHDLRELDSDIVQQYKEHRLKQVKAVTAKNSMTTIKNFLLFCEQIQAVTQGLHELVRIPKTDEDDEICDDFLTREEATAILDHLEKFEYASAKHVTMLILWKTGMRLSAFIGLDLGDFDPARPALEIRHRPDTETPLKKQHNGERDVLLTPETGEVIQDYLNENRPEATDEHGRRPLVPSKHGRRIHTSVQKIVYSCTRPCVYNGGSCPFGEDVDTCEYTYYAKSFKCPGSVSPHAIRRGYVTAARNAGQPKDVTGERANMSGRVLDKHYDKGAYDEKAERRREYLQDF